MKICVLAVCAGLMFLTAGGAFAGGTQSVPYSQCEPEVKSGTDPKTCLGCKTEEVCGKEEEAVKLLTEATEVTFYVMDGSVGTGKQPILGGYDPVENKVLAGDLAREVATAFRGSLRSGNYFAMCFNPHHALMIKTPDHLYEYVLCYDCTQMEIYIDSSYISRIPTIGDPERMNALVVKAGMTLPKDYVEQLEWKKVGDP